MTTQNHIAVVAAIVDTRQLTLYKQNGSTVRIPQGDPRLERILKEVTPTLVEGGVAHINLGGPNVYADFEKQSNGLVKMFRVAKSALGRIFTKKDAVPSATPMQIGNVPSRDQPITVQSAIEEVMQHAVPASSTSFQDVTVTPDSSETVVAVVDGKVIPGVENLKPQLARSVKSGSAKGMNAFMQRLANVIEDRQHSVDDLLRFMQRGDLPVADDGCIVIYKVLRYQNEHKNTYVDCHTRKVPQKVGSYVVMDPSLVDPDRRNECSSGLHVARRAYIGNFSGDVCVIAKVAPEDVIAVPEHDPNKMRVCGYHILYELPAADFEKLKRNQPFTDNDASKRALANILAGNHVGKLEEVRIMGQYGQDVVITVLGSESSKPSPEPVSIEKGEALEDKEDKAPVIDPRQVSKQVQSTKAALGRNATAAKLWAEYQQVSPISEAAEVLASQLHHLKKTSKVSWAKLGLPEDTGEQLKHLPSAPAVVATKPMAKPVTKAKATKVNAKPKVKPKVKPKAVAKANEKALRDDQKEALKLVRAGETKSETARLTGISRRSIDRLLEKYGHG